MPLEAGVLLLEIVGLGAPLWWATGQSLDVLLWIAHTVAGAKGAVAMLPSIPAWAFGLMVLGGLWLCIWKTARVGLLGLVPFVLGASAAAMSPSPDVLITGDGRHLAVVGPDGTPMILRDRSGDFVQDLMSEASGFEDEPQLLADAPFGRCSRDACAASIRDEDREYRVLATRLATRIDWSSIVRACAEADIVVSDRWLPQGCKPRWLKLDRNALQQTGGLAIYLKDEPKVDTVSERLGQHPWAK